MSTTLYDLLVSMSKRLGRYETGIATAASGTRLTDAASFTEGSGFWTGGTIFIDYIEAETAHVEVDGNIFTDALQTFQVPVDTAMYSAQVRMAKKGHPAGYVSGFLKATYNGVPTGVALATSTNQIKDADLTKDMAWVTFTFATYALSSFSRYALDLGTDTGETTGNAFLFGGPTTIADYPSGTAYTMNGAGTYSSLVGDAELSIGINGHVFVDVGKARRQSVKISSYTGSGVFNFPLVQGVPATGTDFLVTHRRVPRSFMLEAVNTALRSFGPIVKENEDLTVVASQVDYTLPEALQSEKIVQVWLEQDGADEPYWPVPDGWWRVEAGNALRFQSVGDFTAGRTIRLVYYGDHDEMDSDDDVLSPEVNAEYVLNRALAECWLHLHRIEGIPEYERHANLQLQMAEGQRRVDRPRRIGGQLRSRQYTR